MRLTTYNLQLTTFFLIFLLFGISFSQEIINVSVETKRDGDYVSVELAEIIEPKIFKLREPNRIVADFYGAVWDGGKRQIDVNSKRISKIRWAQNSVRPDIVRIVIDIPVVSNAEVIKDYDSEKLIIKIKSKDEKQDYFGASPLNESISKSKIEHKTRVEPTTVETNSREKLEISIQSEGSAKPRLLEGQENIEQVTESKVYPPSHKAIIPSEKIDMPPFWKLRKYSIFVNGQKLKLGLKPLFRNKILFVSAYDLLTTLSFEVSFSQEKKILTAKYQDNEVKISEDESRFTINGAENFFEEPAERISGRLQVPFFTLIKALGFAASWDENIRILYVLPRITNIKWDVFDGEKSIIIESTHNIPTFEIESRGKPLILKVGIPNFILDVQNARIPIDDEGIKGIKAIAQNSKDVKIGIYADEDRVSRISSYGKNIVIKFPSIIKAIAVSEEAESIKIKIKALKPILPQIKSLDEPNRILIDIPNAIFSAVPNIEVNKGGILRIRASQFSLDPLSSRIVIDLLTKLNYSVDVSADGRYYSLIIEKQEIAQARLKRLKIFKKKIIVIDPGHGGTDPGSYGFSGDKVKEKDLTLSTSLKLAKMFSDAGAIVHLTREDDITLDLKSRVAFAVNNKADILLCMHYNSFYKPGTEGTETYYYNSNSKLLGELVHKNMLDNLGRADRKLSKIKFFVIYNAPMPSVLIEPIYISNEVEEKFALDAAFQNKIAESIFQAVKKYFETIKEVG